MYRPLPLTIVFTLLALLVGWGTGSYLTSARATAALANLPAAPVVLSAAYDKQDRRLTLTVSNPGLVPIELLDKTLVFRPASGKGGWELARAPLPGGVVELAPGSIEALVLELKEGSPDLKIGDVLASSLTYRYANLPDLYQLTHLYRSGSGSDGKGSPAAAGSAGGTQTSTSAGTSSGASTGAQDREGSSNGQ